MLLEVVYNHIGLFLGQVELNIQYFIDNLIDPLKNAKQALCRVEVDMMAFLSSRGNTKTLALTYFKDCLSLSEKVALVFQYPPFYLHLAAILRDSAENVLNKELILDILYLRL